MLKEEHKAILNQAMHGWIVLILPSYNPSAGTTLEYEENLKRLRKPYEEMVKYGYIVFEGRHVGRERYKLTAKGLEVAKIAI